MGFTMQCSLVFKVTLLHVTSDFFDSAIPLQDYWWHYCKEILANNGGKLKALKEKVLYDFLCLEHVCNLALKLHIGKKCTFRPPQFPIYFGPISRSLTGACMNSTGSAYIQSFSPATAEPVTKKKKENASK